MPRPNSQQALSAAPALRAFLVPILSQSGAPAAFGKAHAELRFGRRPLDDPEFRAIARAYADRLARLIRGSAQDAQYPEPETLSEMARVFRFGGLQWAWPPVLYYAAGHLRPLVEAIATVDTAKLSASTLLELLHNLPAAVIGDMRARERWTLQYSAREAFLPPNEAAGRVRFPLPDDLFLAYVLSERFELPFELQRGTVLKYLIRWAESLPTLKSNARQ